MSEYVSECVGQSAIKYGCKIYFWLISKTKSKAELIRKMEHKIKTYINNSLWITKKIQIQ